MKKIFEFLINFLFIDQKTNQLSHTKFWSNIGYGVMCFTFTYAVMYGSKVDYMLWLLFGVIVIGNRTIKNMLQRPKE